MQELIKVTEQNLLNNCFYCNLFESSVYLSCVGGNSNWLSHKSFVVELVRLINFSLAFLF